MERNLAEDEVDTVNFYHKNRLGRKLLLYMHEKRRKDNILMNKLLRVQTIIQ